MSGGRGGHGAAERDKREAASRPNEDQIIAEAQRSTGVELSPGWDALLRAVVQGVIAALLRKYGH